jgi:PAS domain S-box-containing protein
MAENLSKIINQAPIGILTFGENWKVNYVNESFLKYGILYHFEYSLLGANILEKEIFPGDSIIPELLKLKEGFSFEKELKSIEVLDYGSISLIVKGSPLFEENKFTGGILIIEDLKVISVARDDKSLTLDGFEKIIGRVYDLLFVTDPNGVIKFYFGRYLKSLSLPNDSISESKIAELLNLRDQADFENNLTAAKSKRQSVSFRINSVPGNENSTFDCILEPLINKRGGVQFLFFFLTDVTKTVEKLDALTNEINKLKENKILIEAVSDAVFIIDFDGNITYLNQYAARLFDLAGEDAKGKFFGDTTGIFDRIYFNKIKEEVELTKTYRSKFVFESKDKQNKTIDIRFVKSNGIDHAIIVICNDITQTAAAEQQLQNSLKKYRNLIDPASAAVIGLSKDGVITFANNSFLRSLRYTEETILNKNIKNLLDPAYVKKNEFNLSQLQNIPFRVLELPFISKRKEIIKLLSAISPIIEEKKVTGFNCYLIDTGNKQLVPNEVLLFRYLFESSNDGMALETNKQIILANDSFAKIFGYENSEQLLRKDILDLVSTDDVLKVAEYFQIQEKLKEAPRRFEFLGKRSDGTNFYTEFSLSGFEHGGKVYVITICRDVTERKRAQQAIRESEEKYRSVTDNLDDFLYSYQRLKNNLKPVFCTTSIEKITGFTQSDFLDDAAFLLKIVHPDDFQFVKNKLKGLFKSKIQLSEEFEFRILNKHGNIVWIRNKINIVKGLDGRIQKLFGLVSDITLRKKAEDDLKKSTDNLIKLNETKDRFISIVSHDLRTPFSSILGFTDLLLRDEELTETEKRQYIEFIQESSQSMLLLVNSLLDWTRLQTGRIRFEPERIDSKDIIDNAIKSLSGAAFQKVLKIKSSVEEDYFIFVDRNLVTQIFNNLISNAIKFSNKGGEIIISAMPSEHIRFMEFSVRDYGTGIKPENIKKLFGVDTKFTSEGTAGEKGSGLGLSLVSEIIQKHGGNIRVESEYGKGSDFRFTLPIASAIILLVDNNKTDRILYSKILKNITPDYEVAVASNGKEAFEIVKTSPPALIISENLMPIMNGYQLIKELKKADIKGKPPVIILSSNIDRQGIQDYNNLGIEYVFQKPVNLSSFKQAVERSLRKGLSQN